MDCCKNQKHEERGDAGRRHGGENGKVEDAAGGIRGLMCHKATNDRKERKD